MKRMMFVAAIGLIPAPALAWEPHIGKHEFTGKKVFLMVSDGEYIDQAKGLTSRPPKLFFGCRGEENLVGMAFSGVYLKNGIKRVEYRADDSEIKTFPVEESVEGSGLFVTKRAMVDVFVKEAMSGSVLMLRAPEYKGLQIITKFDVSGAAAAYAKVKEECGWKN